ncbi:MAG TPA: AraC family transcriptional regulator [Acidimicrobiales bacterium]
MDVLTDLLARSRARGAGFSHTTLHGPAALAFPPGPGLAVHVMVDGEAHLRTAVDGDVGPGGPDRPDGAGTPVRAGDVVLVRGPVEHALAHPVDAAATPLAEVMAAGPLPGTARGYVVGPTDRPVDAVFFCGAYLFDGDLCDGVLTALPDTIVLRPAPGGALRATTDLLAREILSDAPGQQALLDRLLDVMLVLVLRHHFEAAGDAAPPWFRASADPGVGAALQAIHADPAAPWTVASLARVASLSRGAFARRFRELLGVPPLGYLTSWRMALARERLRDGHEGLAAVAAAVGYRSEFAFAAAFKRHHGVAPGRWRATAAAASHDARAAGAS